MKARNGSAPRSHTPAHRTLRKPVTRSEPTHEDIAERAFALWLAAGCVHGRDLEFWFEAERQLRNRSADARPLAMEASST